MKIAKTGFWSGDTAPHHKFDVGLANALTELFKGYSVIDLGCGEGKYVEKFVDNGILSNGIDGNPDADNHEYCSTWDLTIPFPKETIEIDKGFGLISNGLCILSLEVGEHIPKEHTNIYLHNIKIHDPKLIVISWAIPNQGGDGHVNELTNDEVKKMFSEYQFDEKTSQHLRDSADLWWFKNTIMVFKKV